MASSYDLQFARDLRGALERLRAQRLALMAQGQPFDLYNRSVGYAEGIEAGIAAIDLVYRGMFGEPPKNDAETRRKVSPA